MPWRSCGTPGNGVVGVADDDAGQIAHAVDPHLDVPVCGWSASQRDRRGIELVDLWLTPRAWRLTSTEIAGDHGRVGHAGEAQRAGDALLGRADRFGGAGRLVGRGDERTGVEPRLVAERAVVVRRAGRVGVRTTYLVGTVATRGVLPGGDHGAC